MFWVYTSSPTGWTCLKNLQWKSSRRHPSQTVVWMAELRVNLSPATLMRKLISAACIYKLILILYPELMIAGERCNYWLNSFFTTAVRDSTASTAGATSICLSILISTSCEPQYSKSTHIGYFFLLSYPILKWNSVIKLKKGYRKLAQLFSVTLYFVCVMPGSALLHILSMFASQKQRYFVTASSRHTHPAEAATLCSR